MGRQASIYLEMHQIEKIEKMVEKDSKFSSFSEAVRWIINKHFTEEH